MCTGTPPPPPNLVGTCAWHMQLLHVHACVHVRVGTCTQVHVHARPGYNVAIASYIARCRYTVQHHMAEGWGALEFSTPKVVHCWLCGFSTLNVMHNIYLSSHLYKILWNTGIFTYWDIQGMYSTVHNIMYIYFAITSSNNESKIWLDR